MKSCCFSLLFRIFAPTKTENVMKMKRLSCLFAWLLAVVALANDGVFYVNGNQIVPLKETDVAVTKEVLTITIGDDEFARVDVQYEFTNRGKAKTIDVGFEAQAPYNSDDGGLKTGKHPDIYDFVVEMNGQKLPIRNYVVRGGNAEKMTDFVPLDPNQWREPTDADDAMSGIINKKTKENIDHSYAYCFKADFKEGKNVVHHTYRYRQSGGVYQHFDIPYWLLPAMRWANHQIDDFTLRIKVQNTAKQFCMVNDAMWKTSQWKVTEGVGKVHVIKDGWGETEYLEFSLRNGTFEWHGRNFRPTSNFSIMSPDGFLFNRNDFKLGRFYDRTAGVLVPYDKMDGDDQAKGSTAGILNSRILRNLPYASRGYVFKDAKLAAYFKSLWWYMPDPSWQQSTADFTEREKEWIQK